MVSSAFSQMRFIQSGPHLAPAVTQPPQQGEGWEGKWLSSKFTSRGAGLGGDKLEPGPTLLKTTHSRSGGASLGSSHTMLRDWDISEHAERTHFRPEPWLKIQGGKGYQEQGDKGTNGGIPCPREEREV